VNESGQFALSHFGSSETEHEEKRVDHVGLAGTVGANYGGE
jgi:hypothetical protein